MNIVIILTLVYMFSLFGAIVFRLAKCPREERLKRLKNFKHGKFALIYLAVIPLFFLAHRYNGQSIDGAFWLSVRACIEVVVLRFDFAAVAPLLTENVLYHVAIECLFSLVVLNTLMFTLSFCGQWLYNRVSLFIARRSRKKIVAVIGSGKNALDILCSVPKGYKAILFCELTPELKEKAYLCGAAAYALKSGDDLGILFKKFFGDFSKRNIAAIVALEDDAKSLLCVKQFCSAIATADQKDLPLTEDRGLKVYVFASKANEEIFAHYVEASNGVVRFVNRHKQIALDFIDRYPFTQFMTEREIDYATATIREGIDLNIFMIGFGKLNESLFLASVSNNQFLTLKDGKLTEKPVCYRIYDRYYPQGKFTENAQVHSGDLHYGYLRYREFLDHYKGRENEFLELLPMPADVKAYPLEVTHPDFYSSIRSELTRENTYNYVIVSFGTDMENIGLAEKLQQKLREWEVTSPVKIFVKVRDASATKVLCEDLGEVVLFGSDRGSVYNAELILHEKIDRMARLRHLLYTAEDKVKSAEKANPDAMDDMAIQEAARKKWYSFKEYQRESNLYACLSVRMKLQLCGYDYAECGEDRREEFLRTYEENDRRIPSALETAGKPVWQYSNAAQFRDSLRWTFAVQEHQRWCAYMIARGFVPCNKREILSPDKKKMLEKRKHGNLTTMEGLVEFREMIANATGKTTEETDVIRYDYQLMDDADWLLNESGYKIIQKN